MNKHDPADPQCKRVYDFEDLWAEANVSTLSLRECRNLIGNVCLRYGIKPPPVRQHHHTEQSFTLYDDDTFETTHISLRARDQKNPFVALHEAAHHVANQIFGADAAHGHGPEFVGIYFVMLELSKTAPLIAIHACARAMKLNWMSFEEISPTALKGRAASQKRSGKVS